VTALWIFSVLLQIIYTILGFTPINNVTIFAPLSIASLTLPIVFAVLEAWSNALIQNIIKELQTNDYNKLFSGEDKKYQNSKETEDNNWKPKRRCLFYRLFCCK